MAGSSMYSVSRQDSDLYWQPCSLSWAFLACWACPGQDQVQQTPFRITLRMLPKAVPWTCLKAQQSWFESTTKWACFPPTLKCGNCFFFPFSWNLLYCWHSSYGGDDYSGQAHCKCFVQQFWIKFLGNKAMKWSSLCSYGFKGAFDFSPCWKRRCKWASTAQCLLWDPLALGLRKSWSALSERVSTSQKGAKI